eukprot:XP_020401058.1 kinesin-like protein KIN-7L [Zea mays]
MPIRLRLEQPVRPPRIPSRNACGESLRAAGPVLGASFAFDHVFDGAANNERIYGTVVQELVGAIGGGFNGTAFTYGQTSCGKTFTMNGSDADPGIIRRAVRDVFDTVRQADDREFLTRVSYMEIYNEEINSLLTLEGQKLRIHESLDVSTPLDIFL